MNAPILITGAAGFIGSNLTERLAKQGEYVRAIDSFDGYYLPAAKRANLAATLRYPNARLIEGDIGDGEWLARVMREVQPRAVAHLAARPGVRASFLDPQRYVEANVTGTLHVLRACELAGVERVIVASSSSVYGNAPGLANEHDTPLRPLSPYGASKVAAEALCSSYAASAGLSVTALRFFTVYGRRQRPDMAIHKFTAAIEAGEEISLFGGESTSRDYTNVDDITDGIIAALSTELPGFQIFNLGAGRPVLLGQIVSLLEQGLGHRAVVRHLPAQPGDPDRTAADITLARTRLGYSPRVSIEDGIDQFLAWYRSLPAANLIARTEVAA